MSHISIYNHSNGEEFRQLFSSNPFFKTAKRFIIEETEYSISFTIATSVTRKKSYKACDAKSNQKCMCFRSNLAPGNYSPDEDDSNEDTLYFNL